jgi:type 1 glutamine amidotransferase
MPFDRRGVLAAGACLAGTVLWTSAQSAQSAHSTQSAQSAEPFSVLVVGATAGYRHDSIPAAIEVIRRLGQDSGAYRTTALPEVADLAAFTPELLAQHQVVFFASTSGELPLDVGQRQALLEFVLAGGGFGGAHAAADTLYEWPEYGDLIGAYFKEHPWTKEVRVTVDAPDHPTVQMLPPSFMVHDEIYTFRTNPRQRPGTQVLLSLDAGSVGAAGDFPLAWCHPYGAGRVLYNALGHFDAVWWDPLFGAHLLASLRWLAGR